MSIKSIKSLLVLLLLYVHDFNNRTRKTDCIGGGGGQIMSINIHFDECQ